MLFDTKYSRTAFPKQFENELWTLMFVLLIMPSFETYFDMTEIRVSLEDHLIVLANVRHEIIKVGIIRDERELPFPKVNRILIFFFNI